MGNLLAHELEPPSYSTRFPYRDHGALDPNEYGVVLSQKIFHWTNKPGVEWASINLNMSQITAYEPTADALITAADYISEHSSGGGILCPSSGNVVCEDSPHPYMYI